MCAEVKLDSLVWPYLAQAPKTLCNARPKPIGTLILAVETHLCLYIFGKVKRLIRFANCVQFSYAALGNCFGTPRLLSRLAAWTTNVLIMYIDDKDSTITRARKFQKPISTYRKCQNFATMLHDLHWSPLVAYEPLLVVRSVYMHWYKASARKIIWTSCFRGVPNKLNKAYRDHRKRAERIWRLCYYFERNMGNIAFIGLRIHYS